MAQSLFVLVAPNINFCVVNIYVKVFVNETFLMECFGIKDDITLICRFVSVGILIDLMLYILIDLILYIVCVHSYLGLSLGLRTLSVVNCVETFLSVSTLARK
jgi:hypothetical protein